MRIFAERAVQGEKKIISGNVWSNGHRVREKRRLMSMYTTHDRSRLSYDRVPTPCNGDGGTTGKTASTHALQKLELTEPFTRHGVGRLKSALALARSSSEWAPTGAKFS